MPPKPKFKKEEIISCALDIVSKQGIVALTAKHLGRYRLGSSARPIFTVFASMSEVQQEVRQAAMKYFDSYSPKMDSDIPMFKKLGIKMVHFANKEPKLFQLLFMQENEDADTFDDVYDLLSDTAKMSISAIEKDYGLSTDKAKKLFENVWIYTFGIGVLCATGACHFSERELSEMLSQQFNAVMTLISKDSKSK